MYVRCGKCYNHYDDSWQSPKCKGVTSGNHRKTAISPFEEHVAATRAVRALHSAALAVWTDAAPLDGVIPYPDHQGR